MKVLSINGKLKALAGIAALGLALGLAGCASTESSSKPTKPAATPAATSEPASASTPVAPPSGDMGTVVFFRESKFVGGAVSFKVREGETELGKLSSGTYFTTQVPVGPHAFTVHSEAKDVLNLEVERGETYYVQGSISMGVLVGRPNLAPSDAATFNALKADLKNSAEPKKKPAPKKKK
jgi:hypothetical protein